MFLPIENGYVYEIPDNAFGYVYKCNLPEVGYGANSITGEIQKTDIIGNDSGQQKWERFTLPKEWKAKRESEKERQKFDKYYIDPYLENIRAREWNRRLCGVWFWNFNPKTKKNELRYITGTHYLYITYWKFQGKFMDFRINDMEAWYVVKYCETDPNCLGINEITKRKLGKCFKINTLIRMYDGSQKRVQDIKDGELVMGDDSTDRLVYGCTNGEEEMFDIIPNKGEKFTVNRSHILHCIKTIYSNKSKTKKRIPINITVNEYLKLSKSKKNHLTLKRVGWGNWDDKIHTVDPYFLGIWLGDGSSKTLQITNEDKEVVDYIKGYCKEEGLKYRNFGQESKSGNKLQHSISNKVEMNVSCLSDGQWLTFDNKEEMMVHLGKHKKTPLNTFGKYKKGEIVVNGKSENKIWRVIRKYGLKQNKHIPLDYLNDGVVNRLNLLAGLIDSDGTLVIHKNGNPGYFKIALSNNYPKLQDDLVTLIRSLGFYCGIGIEKAANAKSFCIFGEIEKIPTKVSRKKAWWYSRQYETMLTGFKVESIGVDKYYGFAVNDNHLFLLADGTVVHNTAKLGCWLYERTSRPPMNQHAAFQSKADDDAQEVMKKAIVQPWQKAPDFFRPIYDTMKGDDPNELRFFHTSRRGSTTEQDRDEEDALESWIEYGASGVAVFDGPELDSYGSDEAGKTKKPVSILERQRTVRFCAEIDGEFKHRKQYYTTTVEIEDGEEDNYEFQELTAGSNPLDRNDNNRTKTGLYTYFLPAQKGMYFDENGYPDEQRAIRYLLNERKKLEEDGDTRGLSSFKRKNPMTFKEAFSADGTYTLYDPEKLNEQLDFIVWRTDLTERGDLKWFKDSPFTIEIEENGEKKNVLNEVIWVPNANGKFEKVKGWWPKEPNKVYENNGQYLPNNNFSFRVGYDTFKYDKTKDKRRSNAAAFIYQMKDDLFPSDYEDMFTLRYSFRPENRRTANMDVLMMAWLGGCQMLVERNAGDHYREHYKEWNCSGFLMWLPGETEPGITTDGKGKTTQTICNYTEQYINDNIKKVFFKTLIRKETGWLGFKVEDTEKFDEPMGCGITLIAVKGKKYIRPQSARQDIESIMPYNKAI